MVKTPRNHILILIGFIVAAVLVGDIAFGSFLAGKKEERATKTITPTQTQVKETQSSFSYDGVEGKDALTLLKEKTTIEESQPGMVSSINGRKADASKHEFWAFYVNGQMAQVGSAEYKTKTGDKIEWKIETY